jgi:hypothetical protein
VAIYFFVEPSAAPRQYVTSLQKGEFSAVPNACRVIAPSTLKQYLAGTPAKAVQMFAATTKSQCMFQVDSKPIFRQLDITYEAYTPSLIAPGNGSATSYARYTFALTRELMLRPPKGTQEPPATLTQPPGLGSQAVTGVELYRQRLKTDLVTVLVRVRNVLITVKLWASVGPGFVSVSIPQLQEYAQAAASTSVAAVSREPAVGA